jgi:drug/metabolite transporter (DMT)-like permease
MRPCGVDAKTAGLTLLALIAFASNSLLTRLALGARALDAATFTLARLASGAVVLALLVRARAGSLAPLRRRGALGPVALFCYAAPFSFAYLRIGAAVGALVLFGVVQLTMVGTGIFRGERPPAATWLGLALATGGLAALTVPSVSRPDPLGVALMAVAGVAWAAYTLAGKTVADPIAANAWSFVWASALASVPWLASHAAVTPSARGVTLALISGGVTSGLGYAVWYRALPRLSVMQAAVAQLSVPVLAAFGAALLLHERLSTRFVLCAAAVLGGVAIVLSSRARK